MILSISDFFTIFVFKFDTVIRCLLYIMSGLAIFFSKFYINLFICRYHTYRRKPLPGRSFVMKCIPEPTNRFDRNAVKVVAPSIGDISPDIINMETRSFPNQQYVHEILDQTIGHVPKFICNIISLSIRVHRTLRHAICLYMGEMVHDQGPKFKVIYLLEFEPNVSLLTIANHMKMHNCIASDDYFC